MFQFSNLFRNLRTPHKNRSEMYKNVADLFSGDGWGFLLVDAANAFNLVSQVTALWNATILWPRCSRFLFNTYRGFAVLLLQNSEECLYSQVEVTQGDPLSMSVAMMPLVNSLRYREQYQQSWYADDSACAGPLHSIHSWLDHLIERGPTYGYFAEPTKSVAPKYVEIAKSSFRNVGVKVGTRNRFLGGEVGEKEYCVQFVREKVDVRVCNLPCITIFPNTFKTLIDFSGFCGSENRFFRIV